jgi:LmbE family N-acetylglucosaminyl deacetylase
MWPAPGFAHAVTLPQKLAARHTRKESPFQALSVIAHPDDEYAFSVTVYRIVHELGGIVDQVVITDGAGGYRYSTLAEAYYEIRLTSEAVGQRQLPKIRKKEALDAARILGIRRLYFLDQKDTGYTLDPSEALRAWDVAAVRKFLDGRLRSENYDVVFTLLPHSDTHGHHKAAALLALDAISRLPFERRPAVFAAEPASSQEPSREYFELPGYPLTRALNQTFEFHRSQPLGLDGSLSYQIISNWVIAAHKSQGLFQMDASRHDLERFWCFQGSGAHIEQTAHALFQEHRPAWSC